MNELIKVTPGVATMSSLEMVEFINSQRKQGEAVLTHADFLKKVPHVLVGVAGNFSSYYTASNGKRNPCYQFPKREACLMAMSYSYELQAKVFDRMTELEGTKVAPPAIPQSLPEALRLAADLAEKNGQQAQFIEQQKPAVEFYEKYAEAESTKNLSDVAKLLGYKPQEFPKVLAADKAIFKRNGVWIPTQSHINSGRFVVRAGVNHGFAFNQIRVTPKGEVWLSRKYG